MIQILKLQGTDKQLYQLVGPLVMDPNILQYNNGYPFKTGEQFVWYIAIEEHKVAGFIPLNLRKNELLCQGRESRCDIGSSAGRSPN